MYLIPVPHYYMRTEEHTPRAPFLLLLQPEQSTIGETCAPGNMYACVRKVALRQLGPWLMGRANIRGRWVSVSGAYGSDGLPMTVKALPADAVPLPAELYAAWRDGGGWNGAGSEAPLMRAWAIKTFGVHTTGGENEPR